MIKNFSIYLLPLMLDSRITSPKSISLYTKSMPKHMMLSTTEVSNSYLVRCSLEQAIAALYSLISCLYRPHMVTRMPQVCILIFIVCLSCLRDQIPRFGILIEAKIELNNSMLWTFLKEGLELMCPNALLVNCGNIKVVSYCHACHQFARLTNSS